MRFKTILAFYLLTFILLTVFSYGFVDLNFPLKPPAFLDQLAFRQRLLTTVIFVIVVVSLFGFYLKLLRMAIARKVNPGQVWKLILLAVVVLFFSWPAFSHDIFNYMATAKVTYFYRENPYLVMPIELAGEPMLKFMHAANKYALYAPVWILLTALPFFLSGGKILLGVFTFKTLMIGFYLGLSWLVWKLSGKNLYSLVFFALNPLVLIESLVSAHNDVVMMFFVLLALWLVSRKKRFRSLVLLLISAAIKYSTVVTAPFFIVFAWFNKPEKLNQLIYIMILALYAVFLFVSPLREEIYPWYLIWIIPLVALIPEKKVLTWVTIAFSFGLLMRYTPFLFTRSYQGVTPLIKGLTTFIPPTLTLIFYSLTRGANRNNLRG